MATPARIPRIKQTFKDWIKQQKWLTLIGLPILLAATYAGYYSIWGVLFIFWGIKSTMSGEVYLLEPINRTQNPILFWAISVMWVGFGIMYILADIYQ